MLSLLLPLVLFVRPLLMGSPHHQYLPLTRFPSYNETPFSFFFFFFILNAYLRNSYVYVCMVLYRVKITLVSGVFFPGLDSTGYSFSVMRIPRFALIFHVFGLQGELVLTPTVTST